MQLDLIFFLLAHATSTASNLSSMNSKSNIWKMQQLMKINKKTLSCYSVFCLYVINFPMLRKKWLLEFV